VSRIASDERTAVAKPVCDQAATVPVLLRDDFVTEIRPDPEDRSKARIAIYRLEIILTRLR
jgi:hypothetical protein